NIQFALQNLENESPEYLAAIRDTGVTHVLLGHSEVRRYFGVTDEDVARQAKLVVQAGLIPIVAIGEKQRLYGDWRKELYAQTTTVLSKLTRDQIPQVIIAYEPIPFIGTGLTMSTPEMAGASDVIAKAAISGVDI